jgi:deazaflavin-dependent oxidoreductase (nitroreductase family)
MWFNPITTWIMRSPLHGFVSKNMMLITYTGRKSGQQYTTPVNYLQISNNGKTTLYTTSYRDRVWWRNLRGGAQVILRLRGRDLSAHAQVVEMQEQVAQELEVYLRQSPNLGRYLGVSMDEDGTPDVEDLQRASEVMVVVKTSEV